MYRFGKAFNSADLLENAIKSGSADEVENILEKEKKILSYNYLDGLTPLHIAAASDKGNANKVVDILIKNGANIEAKDEKGCTPLHLAASQGTESTIITLLEKKADDNALDKNGNSPLSYAQANHRNEIVGIFNTISDSTMDLTTKPDTSETYVAARQGARIQGQENNECTSSHLAAAWGNTAAAGISSSYPDQFGLTHRDYAGGGPQSRVVQEQSVSFYDGQSRGRWCDVVAHSSGGALSR